MQIFTYSLFYARSLLRTVFNTVVCVVCSRFLPIFFLYVYVKKDTQKRVLNDANDASKKLHVERAFFCTFTSPRQSWSEALR